MIEKYNHHGHVVSVQSELKGRHRAHCLCYQGCIHFKPGQPDNCQIAQATFDNCVKFGTTTPMWECPKFELARSVSITDVMAQGIMREVDEGLLTHNPTPDASPSSMPTGVYRVIHMSDGYIPSSFGRLWGKMRDAHDHISPPKNIDPDLDGLLPCAHCGATVEDGLVMKTKEGNLWCALCTQEVHSYLNYTVKEAWNRRP